MKINQNKKEVRNLIMQKYISISTNYAICMDITNLGVYGQLLVAVDIAARNIVGHCYHSEAITTEHVCQTITQFAQKRSFLPKIEIIHTDRGSIFTNPEYYDCIDQHKILKSRGSSKGHQNQVVERLFRTLQNILRALILPGWKQKDPDPLKQLQLSSQEMASLIQQAIEKYNSKPHRHLEGLSPNQMEEALFLKHGNEHPQEPTQLIVKNDNSLLAQEAIEYRRQVAQQFKGDWLRFFIEWKKDQEKLQKQVISRIEQSKEQVIAHLIQTAKEAEARAEQIQSQYKNLYHEHLETQKHVHYLSEQAQAAQREKEEKEQRKLKKKQAKKQEIRQTVSSEEFELIINLVKGRGNAKPRRRLALVLLFLTGLRVSNLLLFKVAHGSELFEKGNTHIPLIKGGESRYPLRLSAKGRKMLLHFKEDFIHLKKGKAADMPLFTANHEINKPISRETFDKELNLILTQASIKLEKHLRTHSFRATIITELLRYNPIDEVKEVMGHKSISSTLEYKRGRLNTRQIDKMLSTLDYQSFKANPKKKRNTKKKLLKENPLNLS